MVNLKLNQIHKREKNMYMNHTYLCVYLNINYLLIIFFFK